jgi:hypothetical protein
VFILKIEHRAREEKRKQFDFFGKIRKSRKSRKTGKGEKTGQEVARLPRRNRGGHVARNRSGSRVRLGSEI